ncbi:MAG: DUF1553 domain-containing protein [Bryobacteraceae bacterium]
MRVWEASVTANQPKWTLAEIKADDDTGGQRYFARKDGSMISLGYTPAKFRQKIYVKTEVQNITAIRLDLLTDPNLAMGGPGRSPTGAAALSEFDVEVTPPSAGTKPVKIAIAGASADVNPVERPLDPAFNDKTKAARVIGPVGFAIDGKEETAWSTDLGPGRRNQPRKAVFSLAQPIENAPGSGIAVYLSQKHGGWNSDANQSQNLGRFRVFVTSEKNAVADALPQSLRDILALDRETRSAAQDQALFSYWRTTVTDWKGATETIESLWRTHPEGTSQLVLQTQDELRPTHLLTRGDFLKPGKRVSPGVPAFLNSLPEGAPVNRLTFARWLVDRKAPTTARSQVNRLWQSYFGSGLVMTSEDLGKQSEAPSHPKLLDWLAVEFMDRGWSLKAMHRFIVTSATYKQSSKVTPELYSRDPYNRLLARGPRFRVEAEAVRDIALAASGLLNPKLGGPSVYPPAPAFLFLPPASYGPKVWNESQGQERYRRAMYTFRYRSTPYPALESFDAPPGDVSCVRRSRSNTPLQALTTLNEPLFVEAAHALATRTLKDGGTTDAQRIQYAFRRCVSRKPTPAEETELLSLLAKQTNRAVEGKVDAWTAVARVLLNLDETITKE